MKKDKPKIILLFPHTGTWVCRVYGDYAVWGYGKTPIEAYNDWENQKRNSFLS